MSVLSIRQLGDPLLRTAADPVPLNPEGTPEPRVLKLIEDMHQTTVDAQGIGLAAPQVGVGLRIFTWNVNDQQGCVINPSLDQSGEAAYVPLSEDDEVLKEGCLSIQGGIYGPVLRSPRVVLTGIAPNGSAVHIPAEGLLAACFQHEMDHLNGRLFLDRLTGEHKKRAYRQLREGVSA